MRAVTAFKTNRHTTTKPQHKQTKQETLKQENEKTQKQENETLVVLVLVVMVVVLAALVRLWWCLSRSWIRKLGPLRLIFHHWSSSFSMFLSLIFLWVSFWNAWRNSGDSWEDRRCYSESLLYMDWQLVYSSLKTEDSRKRKTRTNEHRSP